MAPGVRAPDGTVGAKLRLEPAHAFAAVAHRRRPATAGAGWPERGPRFIPGRAATQGGPAAHGGRRPRRRAIRAPSVVARRPSMGPGPHRRLRGSRPRRVSRPRLAGRRRPRPHGAVGRAAHASTVHDCHGDDRPGLETTPGRRRVMGDVVLFRRLLSQARPYWPHVAALFLLSLLSSPLSLLTPLPLKIAVDSVIGSH